MVSDVNSRMGSRSCVTILLGTRHIKLGVAWRSFVMDFAYTERVVTSFMKARVSRARGNGVKFMQILERKRICLEKRSKVVPD